MLGRITVRCRAHFMIWFFLALCPLDRCTHLADVTCLETSGLPATLNHLSICRGLTDHLSIQVQAFKLCVGKRRIPPLPRNWVIQPERDLVETLSRHASLEEPPAEQSQYLPTSDSVRGMLGLSVSLVRRTPVVHGHLMLNMCRSLSKKDAPIRRIWYVSMLP